MKILITADLHFRRPWFRWLIEQAANYDLVCIGGDLLDMFAGESRTEQAREVTRLIRELANHVPVAICSGQSRQCRTPDSCGSVSCSCESRHEVIYRLEPGAAR